jgi:hypothetical protein
MAGGDVLPREEFDYGGTRVLSPAVALEVAGELAAFGEEDIEHRYRTVDFTGSYGVRWGVHTRSVERYLDAFHEVRDLYAETAKRGDAAAAAAAGLSGAATGRPGRPRGRRALRPGRWPAAVGGHGEGRVHEY